MKKPNPINVDVKSNYQDIPQSNMSNDIMKYKYEIGLFLILSFISIFTYNIFNKKNDKSDKDNTKTDKDENSQDNEHIVDNQSIIVY